MTASLVLSARALQAALVDEASLPPHLRCNSCNQPVVNSFQTPHGCRLCQTCLDGLPAQEKVRCPGKSEACRDEDEEIDICQATCIPDIASRREIGKLKVFCPNKADGCQAKFAWRDADAHLADCDFEKVECDKCGEVNLKKEMEEHKKDKCRQRPVTCADCRTQVAAFLMESEHRNLQSSSCCSSFTAPCPHCSEGSFDRPGFLRHLSECRRKPMHCKFAHVGCDYVAPVADLEAHNMENADKHLELIDARLKASAHITGAFAASAGASNFSAAASATPMSSDMQTKEVKDLEQKAMKIFNVFKKLQPNVATWALTTIEMEEMLKAFGGASGFKTMLKNMDDKLRQLEAAERASASGSGTAGSGSASGAAQSATSADVARVLEQMRSLELRFEILEQTSFDGCLTWKIPNVLARQREARSGSPTSLFSPPFVNKRYGYMFRVRLFLNGYESGEGSHVAVQLVLIPSEYDDVQDWPLVADVTFRIFHRNRADDIAAKAILTAQRPPVANDLSVNASVVKFLRIDLLEDKYLRNECLYLETEVELRQSEANRRGRRR